MRSIVAICRIRESALDYAADRGHRQIVRLMISRLEEEDHRGIVDQTVQLIFDDGAPIDAADENGETALARAVRHGRLSIVRILISRGADVEIADPDGRNPLLVAIRNRNMSVTSLLLERGNARVDAPDARGRTPLIRAILSHNVEMVGLLLKHGATVHSSSPCGEHPFEVAQRTGRHFTELILSHCADTQEKASQQALMPWQGGVEFHLGQFEILERLGARTRPTAHLAYYGVNSAVFKAQDIAHPGSPVVAVKVIYNVHADTNLSDKFKADFEFIEAAEYPHPNILTGLGHFRGVASRATLGPEWDADAVHEQSLFIVLEYLDTTLQSLISRRAGELRQPWPPVLSMDEFLVITQRVLRGVDHLARNGIVHRDIKADNILVHIQTPDHDSPPENKGPPDILVKLADFGHALKPQDKENLLEPYVNEGLPKGGASAYLAPEIETARPGSVAAPNSLNYSKNDVFAVGMMTHYILTNCTGDAFSQTHPHYSEQTYNKLPDGCPQEIADFVWAMLNPSFDERITAAEALAKADELLRVPNLQWG